MTCDPTLSALVCACIALAGTESVPQERAALVCSAIERLAPHSDLDPVLVAAVAWRESRFDPAAQGTAGERGVLQVKPYWILHPRGPFASPYQLHSVEGGVKAGLLTMVRFRAYAQSSRARHLGVHPRDWLNCYGAGVACDKPGSQRLAHHYRRRLLAYMARIEAQRELDKT